MEREKETASAGSHAPDGASAPDDGRASPRQPGDNLDPSKQIASLQLALEQERSERAEIEAQAGLLCDGLSRTKQLLDEEKREVQHVQASLAWQFVTRFHALGIRWLPFGSLRREICRRAVAATARFVLGRRAPAAAGASPPGGGSFPNAAGVLSAEGTQARPAVIWDLPQPGDYCSGTVLVKGWVLGQPGGERAEIFLDERKLGNAIYRQGCAALETNGIPYPDAGRREFFFAWDSTQAAEGAHVLSVSVKANAAPAVAASVPITVGPSSAEDGFDIWLAANETSPSRLGEMAREAEGFAYQPVISVVVPVHRTSMGHLPEAMDSVRNQIYRNWELCLADDGSHLPELTRLLENYAAGDARIKFVELPESQGISAATNAALALATGEFAGFLGPADELAPDAFFWIIKRLQDHRSDLIYSDEDKLGAAEKRYQPFFKPDWSPDLLLSGNYIGRFLVVRREVLLDAGGLRSEYDESQDYDLLLRLIERTRRIDHIPRILYHRREPDASSARVAAERAITDYLKRNNIRARVERGCAPGQWMVRYEILEHPRVAIILPTGGRLELLRPCLESFLATTDYPNYEILLVDNSKGPEVADYAARLARETGKLRLIDYRNRAFNYSALNNFAAGKTEAPLLLLLNDDTTMVNRDWLTAMVEHGQRPEVGAVGAKLLYPSGRIQHAGAVMGIYEGTSHAFKQLPGNSRRYFGLAQVVRNCSHVTAACLMTRRSLYLEFGGLDETHFKVAFQDVDYCLRLHKAGYLIVYTPAAVLVHHESVTKDEKIPNMREVRYLRKKWAEIIDHDPFYNPNLSRKSEDFGLRFD